MKTSYNLNREGTGLALCHVWMQLNRESISQINSFYRRKCNVFLSDTHTHTYIVYRLFSPLFHSMLRLFFCEGNTICKCSEANTEQICFWNLHSLKILRNRESQSSADLIYIEAESWNRANIFLTKFNLFGIYYCIQHFTFFIEYWNLGDILELRYWKSDFSIIRGLHSTSYNLHRRTCRQIHSLPI